MQRFSPGVLEFRSVAVIGCWLVGVEQENQILRNMSVFRLFLALKFQKIGLARLIQVKATLAVHLAQEPYLTT